jgi:putative membrane protein
MAAKDTRLSLMLCSIFLIIGLFAARFGLGVEYEWVSAFFIVIMALPTVIVLATQMRLKGLFTFLSIFTLSIVVEAASIISGLPYGNFSYSDNLGYKLLGLVPWTVGFAFTPILFGSYAIAQRLAKNAPAIVFLTATLNLLVDLVLDPAAVYSGFWFWAEPGIYYGVPIINFVGWAFTSVIYAGIIILFLNKAILDLKLIQPLLLILSFWSGYTLLAGLMIPFTLSAILLFVYWFFTRRGL